MGAYVKLLLTGALIVALLYSHQTFALGCAGDEARYMQADLQRRSLRLWVTTGEAPPRGALARMAPAPGRAATLVRVVGLPGDQVGIEDGQLRLNARVRSEVYADRGRSTEHVPDVRVPEGHFFALHDLRDVKQSRSLDSRRLGPLPVATIEAWSRDARAEALLADDGGAGGADGGAP